MFKRMIESEPR